MSISQTSQQQAETIRVGIKELERLDDAWATEFKRVFSYTWPLAEMVVYNYIRTLESEGRWALYEGACIINRMINLKNEGWVAPPPKTKSGRTYPDHEAVSALNKAAGDFQAAEHRKMVDEAHAEALVRIDFFETNYRDANNEVIKECRACGCRFVGTACPSGRKH